MSKISMQLCIKKDLIIIIDLKMVNQLFSL